MWKEFKDFLIKQNAIALAVAVVIGTALNDVVKAIVSDVFMPIVQIVQNLFSTGDSWQTWAWRNFQFGHLANAVLNFFIIGFVAWRFSKLFIKPAPKGTPTTRNCDFCKMTIDVAATRCPHCTSQLSTA